MGELPEHVYGRHKQVPSALWVKEQPVITQLSVMYCSSVSAVRALEIAQQVRSTTKQDCLYSGSRCAAVASVGLRPVAELDQADFRLAGEQTGYIGLAQVWEIDGNVFFELLHVLATQGPRLCNTHALLEHSQSRDCSVLSYVLCARSLATLARAEGPASTAGADSDWQSLQSGMIEPGHIGTHNSHIYKLLCA